MAKARRSASRKCEAAAAVAVAAAGASLQRRRALYLDKLVGGGRGWGQRPNVSMKMKAELQKQNQQKNVAIETLWRRKCSSLLQIVCWYVYCSELKSKIQTVSVLVAKLSIIAQMIQKPALGLVLFPQRKKSPVRVIVGCVCVWGGVGGLEPPLCLHCSSLAQSLSAARPCQRKAASSSLVLAPFGQRHVNAFLGLRAQS